MDTPIKNTAVAIIILAGGLSSRMQEHKPLLPLNNQRLIDFCTAAAFESKARDILVVTGYNHEALANHICHPRIQTLYNKHYKTGLSSSIQCGIAALSSDICGAIIMLADMPLITAQHLNRLIEAFQSNRQSIIAPYYCGQRGNPILWPKTYFMDLMSLKGDIGAKPLLIQHKNNIKAVTFDDNAVLLDIDTPENLQQIKQHLA